jgi:Zn-dependent M16 (insulinase) family peptidase
LEHTDPRDSSTPITFKGIVFNEMKGVMSDAGSLYWDKFREHMYRNTIYGCNSGGNPLDIPALTFNGLKNFHKEHYHPSNAKVFTYGDIPLASHLAALDERFSQFSRLSPEKFSQSMPRFPSTQRVDTTCPLDPLTDPDKQNVTSLSFHANELSDGYFDHFALGVLVGLLTDGHSAPLRKALLDTNIGTDWSPNVGHDAFGKTGFVAFGLQGVQEGDEPHVESEILRVLGEVAETGFESDRIEGILHQMELSLKHKSAHFGKGLMWRATSSWFADVNPIEILLLKSLIEKLRQEIAGGPFFQKLIRKYFLENQSRLVLTMRPDVDFDDKFKFSEKTLLAEKLDALSEADRKNVYEQGLALLEAQEKPDDLSSLPTLTVKDIPVKVETHPVEKELSGKVPVQWRLAPTNGISYFKAMSSLNGLPDHLRPYLPLFADALSSLGTTSKSASEFEDEINLKTDGITGSVHIATSHSGTPGKFNIN